MPFVVEAHGGGLSQGARQVLAYLAKVGAAREGGEVELQAASLMRSISISLQRENVRAILRRLQVGLPQVASANPSAWAETSM